MLRRKLLLILGSLVALLLVAAIGAILMLQNVLVDLDRINQEAGSGGAATAHFNAALAAFDTDVNRAMLEGNGSPPADLADADATLHDRGERLIEPYDNLDAGLESSHQRVMTALASLDTTFADVMKSARPEAGNDGLSGLLAQTTAIRERLADFTGQSQRHTELEYVRLVGKFRFIMLGLGLLFLVLINISVLVLIRTATMILKPVNVLTDASRRLAREEFGHRVNLEQHDEFGELAASYNHLAEQLQHNEQRKIETLQQVARTMNHEVNNALSVIELQLRRIEKSQKECRGLETPLRQIHETLQRIGKTVDALKRVRRIVLTDYVSGVKMLDLERSVDAEPPMPSIETRPVTEIRAK